jgi:hypothetical protein
MDNSQFLRCKDGSFNIRNTLLTLQEECHFLGGSSSLQEKTFTFKKHKTLRSLLMESRHTVAKGGTYFRRMKKRYGFAYKKKYMYSEET